MELAYARGLRPPPHHLLAGPGPAGTQQIAPGRIPRTLARRHALARPHDGEMGTNDARGAREIPRRHARPLRLVRASFGARSQSQGVIVATLAAQLARERSSRRSPELFPARAAASTGYALRCESVAERLAQMRACHSERSVSEAKNLSFSGPSTGPNLARSVDTLRQSLEPRPQSSR